MLIVSYYVLTSFAVFPDGNFQTIRFIKPATFYLFFIILFVQTPFVFKGLHHNAAGHVEPIPAPGIVLFALLAVTFLGGALLIMFRKYRKANGQMRDQLRVVMLGVAASFAGILATNLILASIFKNTSLLAAVHPCSYRFNGVRHHETSTIRPKVGGGQSRGLSSYFLASHRELFGPGLSYRWHLLVRFKFNQLFASVLLYRPGRSDGRSLSAA
jgi:uncharacterized membrane protein